MAVILATRPLISPLGGLAVRWRGRQSIRRYAKFMSKHAEPFRLIGNCSPLPVQKFQPAAFWKGGRPFFKDLHIATDVADSQIIGYSEYGFDDAFFALGAEKYASGVVLSELDVRAVSSILDIGRGLV